MFIHVYPCLSMFIHVYPHSFALVFFYCKNEINTPAATAEPITPEMLLDIQ